MFAQNAANDRANPASTKRRRRSLTLWLLLVVIHLLLVLITLLLLAWETAYLVIRAVGTHK